jgi:hypothetical protein
MFARVVSMDLRPDQEEKYDKMIRDTVVPTLQQQQGFKGGYWLIDRDEGTGWGIALFESKAALDATDETAERIREGAQRQGLPAPKYRTCEVLSSVGFVEESKAA